MLEFCRGSRSRHHCAPESPEELLTSLQHLGPRGPSARMGFGRHLGPPWVALDALLALLGSPGVHFWQTFCRPKIYQKSDSSKSRPKSKKLSPGHQNVDFLMILGTILASIFNQFLMRFRKRPKARISFKNQWKINIFASPRHPFFDEISIKISSFF